MTGSMIRLLMPFATSLLARHQESSLRGPSIVLYTAAAICGLLGIGFLMFGVFFVLSPALGTGQAALAAGGIAFAIAALCVAAVHIWRAIRKKKQSGFVSALLEGDTSRLTRSLGKSVSQVEKLIRENPNEAVTIAVLIGAVAGAAGLFAGDDD